MSLQDLGFLAEYERTISDICGLSWSDISENEFVEVAWAYYFFSIQFRENLEIALKRHPEDVKLRHLEREECDTDNLSPWPGVAVAGEKLNHDEFMRRLLMLEPTTEEALNRYNAAGHTYLSLVRSFDDEARAMSIASYEDGGLERTFRAMLQGPSSDRPVVAAFRHFLSEHIRFDSDPGTGHGALARHLRPDDRIQPVWASFKDLLTEVVPGLLLPGPRKPELAQGRSMQPELAHGA